MQRKKMALFALLPLLLIGLVYAYVYPWVLSNLITTTEPFTISIYDDLSIPYPGQTDTVILQIVNAAPVTYGVRITVSLAGPAVYSYYTVTGTLTEYNVEMGEFNIAQGTGYYWITVTADPAAAPSDIQVAFQVERVAPF